MKVEKQHGSPSWIGVSPELTDVMIKTAATLHGQTREQIEARLAAGEEVRYDDEAWDGVIRMATGEKQDDGYRGMGYNPREGGEDECCG